MRVAYSGLAAKSIVGRIHVGHPVGVGGQLRLHFPAKTVMNRGAGQVHAAENCRAGGNAPREGCASVVRRCCAPTVWTADLRLAPEWVSEAGAWVHVAVGCVPPVRVGGTCDYTTAAIPGLRNCLSDSIHRWKSGTGRKQAVAGTIVVQGRNCSTGVGGRVNSSVAVVGGVGIDVGRSASPS